jgi:hypothetical protein
VTRVTSVSPVPNETALPAWVALSFKAPVGSVIAALICSMAAAWKTVRPASARAPELIGSASARRLSISGLTSRITLWGCATEWLI